MAHTLKGLLEKVIEKKGSDLHINAGLPPQLRIDGRLTPVGEALLTPQ